MAPAHTVLLGDHKILYRYFNSLPIVLTVLYDTFYSENCYQCLPFLRWSQWQSVQKTTTVHSFSYTVQSSRLANELMAYLERGAGTVSWRHCQSKRNDAWLRDIKNLLLRDRVLIIAHIRAYRQRHKTVDVLRSWLWTIHQTQLQLPSTMYSCSLATKHSHCCYYYLYYSTKIRPGLILIMITGPLQRMKLLTCCCCCCSCYYYYYYYYYLFTPLDCVQDYPGEPLPERQNQEGKTNLDLLEQEIVSGSGISWAYANLHLAPDS